MSRLTFHHLFGGWAIAWKWASDGKWERDGVVHRLHFGSDEDDDVIIWRLIIGGLCIWLGHDRKR